MRHDPQRTVLRAVSRSVFVNYLLSNLGYYTLLPVLPLIVKHMQGGEAWYVGTALFVLAFSVRASCLFASRLLHRTTPRVSITGGLLLAAAGFAVLSVSPGPVGILVCLAVAGFGISVNTLMARAFVAMRLTTPGARNTAFSAIQVAVNLAAAAGPVAANLLFGSAGYALCLVAVVALYVVGAVATAVVIPTTQRPSDQDDRIPNGLLGGLRVIVTDPNVRQVAVVALTGWFLYGQLFSALALHISELTQEPLLRSAFFTTNAVLIVLVQLPVSTYAGRRLDTGTPPVVFLTVGVGMFAAAFAVLAGFGGSVAGVFLGVGLFSLAETAFTPFVATAFAEISGKRPVVEVFNLQQIVMAAGESFGAFSGGALFSIAAAHGVQPVYWSVLTIVAMLVVGLSTMRRRGSREDHDFDLNQHSNGKSG